MSSSVRRHSIAQDVRSTISTRYKRVTKAINNVFWDSDSETAHSFYVGSFGRGTAIDTSDVDILVELPSSDFDRFTSINGNGQSRLLQAVKNAVLNTYPNSDVRGDGQVVVIAFSDGIIYEILPAFKNETIYGWDGTYKYPDTHMGGNWMSTNPKAEIEAMESKDGYSESNGLLTATCQHIRYIRDQHYSSYHLSGIVIDSFAYLAIGGWHYLREGEVQSNGSNSYEEYLLKKYNEISGYGVVIPPLRAPGSMMSVNTLGSWETLGKVLRKMAQGGE